MAGLRQVQLDDSMFEGVVSLEKGKDWVRPWRLPFKDLRLFPPDDTIGVAARKPSGVRLRFETDSRRIGVAFDPPGKQDNTASLDLTVDGRIVATRRIAPPDEEVIFERAASGPQVVELWLPQASVMTLRHLLLDEDASVRIPPDKRPKWVTYGSSISSCAAAHSPARTWPATVARAHNLNLTCLGFGGNCHAEAMVARVIRDLPADFISLKIGINIKGAASLSPRTFRPAVIGMVTIIREKHPHTPIALISPIAAPPHEHDKNSVGFTLTAMRDEIEDAARRLIDSGDQNLYYFSGLNLLDLDAASEYLSDGVHPTADGYELLGRNFSKVVMSRIKL